MYLVILFYIYCILTYITYFLYYIHTFIYLSTSLPRSRYIFGGGYIGFQTNSRKRVNSMQGKADAYYSLDGANWVKINYGKNSSSSGSTSGSSSTSCSSGCSSTFFLFLLLFLLLFLFLLLWLLLLLWQRREVAVLRCPSSPLRSGRRQLWTPNPSTSAAGDSLYIASMRILRRR